MSSRAGRSRDHVDITREEADLARRTVAGDRDAFDALFDRYFARLHWYYRDLPEADAQAATWEVLEQLFASLDQVDDVGLHAYRIARR
jgi:DNA-directed RNA polymerase specialized sigma24 family protein